MFSFPATPHDEHAYRNRLRVVRDTLNAMLDDGAPVPPLLVALQCWTIIVSAAGSSRRALAYFAVDAVRHNVDKLRIAVWWTWQRRVMRRTDEQIEFKLIAAEIKDRLESKLNNL